MLIADLACYGVITITALLSYSDKDIRQNAKDRIEGFVRRVYHEFA